MYKKHINSIHVEVTDRCNAECPACPRSYGGGYVKPYVKNQELSIEYFKLLGKDFCSQIHWWNFCGTKGDPSSAQDLFEILEFLLECNPYTRIDIRTNGGARNEKFWNRVGTLFENTNGVVVWSIDGWKDTNHIYRKNVKWNKVWENLLAYTSTGAKSIWEFNKFKHNIDDLPIVESFCKKKNITLLVRDPYGFEDIGIMNAETGYKKSIRTMPVYNKVDDENAILAYEILPHNADELDLVSDHDKNVSVNDFNPGFYNKSNWYDLKNHDVQISCEVTQDEDRQEIFLDSDGMIMPCCYIASKYVMGDEQLHEMFDPYKSDLIVTEANSIYDVLSHKVFQKIMPDAMTGHLDDDVGHCITCVHHCRKN